MAFKFNEPLVKLYQDAGGSREAIRRIVAAFYKKMASDILVGFFFQGKDLEHVIDMQTEFLLSAMGVIDQYTGKTPRAAHKSIPPILKGHFDRRMVLLRQTLEEFKLPTDSVQAWIDFEETFRKGIIEEEGPLSQRKRYRNDQDDDGE